ncbi:kinase [Clostridium magnum]|uniref:L-threonine kinase n=1 Tax=Clostridium magnum DSM 2767 TaxID=1121326 RepID=A0A161X9B8_9CLOT|nr:kinase [Clostridium magnum]KZL90816.1 L-threonine kinase [Clostridium magnum DSM 2767]SHI11803.1 threonine kinase [Clostridium magnum DSM 2767]
MEFTVNYPGSFGEVLQGRINSKDLLLSCPVNVYTTVKVFESNNAEKKFNNQKSAAFLKNVLKLWDYEAHYKDFDIEINSQIPYGKGLASSTADLCGVYYCLLKLFNKVFNEEELVEQCIKIEPTDSIIFKKMTLFDYKKGLYKKTMGDYLNYNILAFEGNRVVDTVEFNNKNLPSLSDVDDLLPILEEAIKEKNLEKLAYVSTESIVRNQKRLQYEFLQEVINIKNKTAGLGIIGAHSGNVLGIIYEDSASLDYALKLGEKLDMCKMYPVKTLSKMDI